MIAYNNSKNVGVVLQVQEDYVKIIDEQGQIRNLKISEISKKFEKDKKISGYDMSGNTLTSDNVVNVVEGRYKGKKAVIKHIHKNILFLWSKEFT